MRAITFLLLGLPLLNGVSAQTDVNECADGLASCDGNAVCTNTIGSYECTCRPGYSGDGWTCTDMNECTDGSHICHWNASCDNAVGSFVCACEEGFTGDGRACTDIDECGDGSHICDWNATCTNTVGSFVCDCKEGFTGNGTACTVYDTASVTAQDETSAPSFTTFEYPTTTMVVAKTNAGSTGRIETTSQTPEAQSTVPPNLEATFSQYTTDVSWSEPDKTNGAPVTELVSIRLATFGLASFALVLHLR